MGAETTRITAEDFLIPPELAAWRLAANGAGRIGGVRLELHADAGRTRLGRCYQQVPLRFLPPFQFSANQPALVYLLNPTAGLMDGDGHRIDIAAGPQTRSLIVGQSATRIHPAVHGFSTQQWAISVDSGALLIALPGPNIPFQGCRYYQQAAVELASDARLIWGDIWLAGRYARGADSERFQFGTIVQHLNVMREERLIYRDRFCWNGPWDEHTASWHFGGQPACGTVFATGPIDDATLAELSCLGAVILPTASGDVCLRWQGSSEEVTSQVVHAALRLADPPTPGRLGASWLFSNDLAPCHWFSIYPEKPTRSAESSQLPPLG